MLQTSRRAILRSCAGLFTSLQLADRRVVAAADSAVGSAQRAPALSISRRAIGNSSESLPVIGLGSWQTFDVGSDAASRAPLGEVLAAFFAGGGRLLDTSPMYGRSEAVLGDLISQLGAATPFLATKVWTSGREAGIRQMEQSLSRLRTRRVDLMQVHNLVDVATHEKTLQAWKAEGRTRYIGITHYTAGALAELERLMKTGTYDFVQINYSLAEREAERRLLPLAQERRIAVIINRPFAEGALFARVKGKALPDWAQEMGAQSYAQLFLKWILGHKAVTCVIPATSKLLHAHDNLAAGNGPFLDAAQRQRIAQFIASL